MRTDVRLSICPWNSVRRKRCWPPLDSGSRQISDDHRRCAPLTVLRTVRVILIDPDNTVFVTNEQGDPAISEEQICGGHADLVWIFPKDYKFIWVLLSRQSTTRRPFTERLTNLECDKPYAFDGIADDEKVFHSSERGDVDTNIEESYTHEAFVEVKGSHEYLPEPSATSSDSVAAKPRTF